MTSRARLERSHADSEQFGSLVPIFLLPLSDKLSSYQTILQTMYNLSGLERLSSPDCGGGEEECVCSLLLVTSKSEILTYLYSEPVSSTGWRLQRWSRRQENNYHYRTENTLLMCWETGTAVLHQQPRCLKQQHVVQSADIQYWNQYICLYLSAHIECLLNGKMLWCSSVITAHTFRTRILFSLKKSNMCKDVCNM